MPFSGCGQLKIGLKFNDLVFKFVVEMLSS